ncbi:hypothetical protein BCR39DRAFT_389603 [Naematelia encephala]|uniref:Uncharacterized protein n=1 Tax=Naematelia encephala TaxID=71784 RepID=A0A1Y2AJW7_9TREE|nr:hypothetical protein BCR39DRAFT_389603 [Naematelia encephala]
MSFPSPQLPGTHPGRTSLSLYNQSSHGSDSNTTTRISDDDSLAVFTKGRDGTTGSLATVEFWSWWDTHVRQPFVEVDEGIQVRARKMGHISPQDQNEILRDIRALSDGLINFVKGFPSNGIQEVTLDRNMTDNTMDVGHSSDILEIARAGNAEHESNFSPLHVHELDFDILLPARSDPPGFLVRLLSNKVSEILKFRHYRLKALSPGARASLF